MKKISVYRPTTIEEAIQILSLHGTEAGVYAGGTDLLIRLKNRLKQAPTYLVDIKKINNLRYIKEDAQGGVRIGALTKLAEIAESDLLARKYPMLVQAVKMISSPELRNASTLGGDLLQEVWCQYLRGGYSSAKTGLKGLIRETETTRRLGLRHGLNRAGSSASRQNDRGCARRIRRYIRETVSGKIR